MGKDLVRGGEGRLQENNNEKKENNSKKITKLVEFTLKNNNPKFPNFWVEK